MDFRLLGPLEAVGSHGALPLGGPKQRALLAVLLLNANEVVSTDRLIDDVWGENAPPTAAASVQNSVSKLRKALGAGTVQTRSPGYALQIDDNSIDARRFERSMQDSHLLPASERATALRNALALWHGPALAEFTFEPFAQAEIARLEELRLVAIEDRIEAELELGLHDELVGELEALVVRHPSREHLRELQLLALYRAGRQTDALRAYQDARVAMIEELGIEPGERLRALERMILAHDPALDLPTAALAARAVPERRTRKTVAVLLGQIEHGDNLDPEAAQAVMSVKLMAAAETVERHGGRLQQLLGDEIVAVFGAVRAHEDDALRALRAAGEIRDALECDGFGVRIGIEAGEMFVGDAAVGLTGGAVTAARRLEGRAEAGEILLGPTALRLAAGAVEIISPETGVYRLLRVVEGAPAVARRLGAPLAGRRDELAQLRAALDDAVEGSRCVRVVVVGDPGKGKTRLATELLATLDEDVLALTGRCVPYGEGATYLPLREALVEVHSSIEATLAGEEDGALVAERLSGIFAPERASHPSSDIAWAVRRLLESLARQRPVVLTLDDVHWADPTLLDLVDYVAEWSSDAPILLVCLGRPELLDDRAAWAGGGVVLEPLNEQDARALVDALPERASVDDNGVETVLAAAEGNPLFLEQLTAFAAEGDLRDGVAPPTVETLLASRLDRLDERQRVVLEWAAVVGREFTCDAVEELASTEERGSVAPTLLGLVRRRLVRPERSTASGDAFTFHHVLVRDVAYGSIPKATRAELHERLARWLDTQPNGLDEIVGFHLEQAHRYTAELGNDDCALAAQAAKRLGSAGRRAANRLDERAADPLLRRALDLVPDDDESRLALAVVHKNRGEMSEAVLLLTDVEERARGSGDTRLELRARLELIWPRITEGDASAEEVLRLADEAVSTFERADDHYGVARAQQIRAIAEVGLRLRCSLAEEAAVESTRRYRLAGTSLTCDALLAQALVLGPTPVDQAIATCSEICADARTERRMLPYVETEIAGLEAMAGRIASARDRLQAASRAHLEYGHLAVLSAGWAGVAAAIEVAAGDPNRVESVLRPVYDELHDSKAWWFATHAAVLGAAVGAQGRIDEALALADEAAGAALPDDIWPQALWRQVRASALSDMAEHVEAERLAREAVQLLEATDALSLRGDALATLSRVLGRAGQVDEARRLEVAALAHYTQKGDVSGMRRLGASPRADAPAKEEGEPETGSPLKR